MVTPFSFLGGGLRIQGIPGQFVASVGCRWSNRSKRATWEWLQVGLGTGQHLSDTVAFS